MEVGVEHLIEKGCKEDWLGYNAEKGLQNRSVWIGFDYWQNYEGKHGMYDGMNVTGLEGNVEEGLRNHSILIDPLEGTENNLNMRKMIEYGNCL